MRSTNRRQFLRQAAGGLGLAAGASLFSCRREAAALRPNIVFILADDLGYGDLGSYGQKMIRTPHLDRLAAEGMRFTDAYAGSTVCAPSRSVLMTGQHTGHTPIRGNGMGTLLSEETIVTELLQRAGYVNGGYGKWGLGEEPGTPGHPIRKGFEEFFGYLNQAHAHRFYPEFLYHNEARYPLPGNEGGQRTTYSHDVIADKAREFIRRNRGNPFFCYCPFTIPHWELLVPEDSLAEYRGKFEERHWPARGNYAATDEPRAAYAAMITRMDREIGRIMDLLRELAIDDNTLVIFSSDNGPILQFPDEDYFNSRGPFRGGKGNFYEAGNRVPTIARWPGKVAAGTVSDHPWAFWDFFPTVAELAGFEPPQQIDGVSVVPTLLGKRAAGHRQQVHEFMYWELPRGAAETRWAYRDEIPMQAVRMGEWKAVRPKPEAPLELYNLAEDPGETTDLAPRKPDALRQIENYLKAARTEPRPPVPFEDQWRRT